jgi:N-acetylglucosaminyl-diphospho-decaprenol L-rhamnosyltransferase
VIRSETSVEVDWVTGASVMLRMQALRETGLFDDGFFLYFDEVELMHRMRGRGWGVRFVPASRVTHLEGAATGVGESSTPLPAYWYDSRRRYFALTDRISGVLRANLGWLAGSAVMSVKRLALRREAPSPLRLTGIWHAGGGATPSVPRLGDETGRPPAWMQKAIS